MRFALLLALAALTGCASVRSYPIDTRDPEVRQQLTERAARRDVTVRLLGEAGIQARALSVRADSTSWVDPVTGESRTVSTRLIRAVTVPGRRGGTLSTIAIGIGSGAVVGGLLGWGAYEVGIATRVVDSSGDLATYGAAGGAAVGLLSGAFVASERRRSQLFRVVTPVTSE